MTNSEFKYVVELKKQQAHYKFNLETLQNMKLHPSSSALYNRGYGGSQINIEENDMKDVIPAVISVYEAKLKEVNSEISKYLE